MIYRYIQKQIEEQITHYPIVLLTGPGQTGKSTCLQYHFAGDRYAYVSLDDSLEKEMFKMTSPLFHLLSDFFSNLFYGLSCFFAEVTLFIN